jgi:glycosyltransferase involved in cell wall biosynthesis
MSEISVIICSHNPRPDYLKATLQGLQAQTLPKGLWEFLLIDNASEEPLAKSWDVSWHPGARHVLEKELGLMPARLRGIREASGEILVFVDDDNILAPDYLENALKIAQSHPFVGAYSGNIVGEYETKPENWAEPVIPFLAIVPVKHEEWAFRPGTKAQPLVPCGAGMVIRKSVAVYYAKRSGNDPLRRGLGRKGASLSSAEDIDMALSACACGLAVGRFPQLQMKHLIAARRLQRDYLLRLFEESMYSDAILQFVWRNDYSPDIETPSRLRKLYRYCKSWRNRLKDPAKTAFNEDLERARNRGFLRAAKVIQTVRNGLKEQSQESLPQGGLLKASQNV